MAARASGVKSGFVLLVDGARHVARSEGVLVSRAFAYLLASEQENTAVKGWPTLLLSEMGIITNALGFRLTSTTVSPILIVS